MTPYDRLRRCGGPLGLALTLASAAGCAPDCYDDGLFQKPGCAPAVESATGTTDPTTGSTTLVGTGSGSGESGVMTADGDSGTTSPMLCPGLDQELEYELLTFQIVVEQSNAMLDPFDGVPRWDAIEDALVDVPDGTITERQSTNRFGVATYHGLQAGCPQVESVAPQLDAADEIRALFGMLAPAGANPVADAVEEVVDDLAADPWDGPKSMVLVIANEPSTCALPAPGNAVDQAITREAAETAVADAFVAGFPTVVVTLGEDIDATFLQTLANAGAGQQPGDPDATFYVTHDAQELTDALAAIFDPDRPCSFGLDVPLSEELVPGCTLEVNDMEVVYDDPNGWGRLDDQTVELRGTACEAIQQGDATVELVCSCDV
jgi:hypothetical protein